MVAATMVSVPQVAAIKHKGLTSSYLTTLSKQHTRRERGVSVPSALACSSMGPPAMVSVPQMAAIKHKGLTSSSPTREGGPESTKVEMRMLLVALVLLVPD